MSKRTEELAAKLDEAIIENFADLYILEDALKAIEKRNDLDHPEVIAAIATCADVASAQQRLIARPPAALVKGLTAALERKLRNTSELLVRALLDGAQRESAAGPAPEVKQKKPLPGFARPVRLPPLVHANGKAATAAETEALIRAIAASDEPPESDFTEESLAQFGRALALGWLSYGAEPKHSWTTRAAAHFPDDATARDLGMMARELGPRVGQFSKAQILVEVLGAMNTRAALASLHDLATKVKTKSVKDRAKAAFDAAAKCAGTNVHDLADKLITDDAPVGRDFVRRLEERMISATTMPALDFIENIMQRDALRERARGIVFGAHVGSKVVQFTIIEDRLVTIDGDDYELPAAAKVGVMHPFDLSAKWERHISGAPFPQLERPIQRFASLRAMKKHVGKLVGQASSRGAVFGLEAIGWKRGSIEGGGTFSSISRELDGMTATVDFRPGIYAGRGSGMAPRITSIEIDGKGSVRAMAEIAREIELLVVSASRGRRTGR